MTKIFAGIDPGLSGGLAYVRPDGQGYAIKMPATERDILDQIRDWGFADPEAFVFIERVHAMPGEGRSSISKFMMNYGFLRGVLTTLGCRFEAIPPPQWQKVMGLILRKTPGGRKYTKTEKKNFNKARAQELFPSIKMTHAIADALLIAECCRRIKA